MRLSYILLGLLVSISAISSPVSNLTGAFYKRNGLGKMPRLNWAEMPLVNVMDCGADNTGKKLVGPAFRKAVSKLSAKGGGVVYIPSGIYRFRNPISDHKRYEDRYSWLIEGLKNIHLSETVLRRQSSLLNMTEKHIPATLRLIYGWSGGVKTFHSAISVFRYFRFSGCVRRAWGRAYSHWLLAETKVFRLSMYFVIRAEYRFASGMVILMPG